MDGLEYTTRFEAPNGKPILKAYFDPLTGGPPITIGLGHTGPDVKEGETWSEERCWHAFYNDYAHAEGLTSQVIGSLCWASLSEPRRAVLTDMAFNLGGGGLAKFRNMLDAVRRGQWDRAKAELLNSEYAHDVPSRAAANAAVLLTGQWPASHQTDLIA